MMLLQVAVPLGLLTSRAGDILPGSEGPLQTQLVEKPDLECFQPGDKALGDVVLDRGGDCVAWRHVT
jgi:hypothetical protein